MEVITLDLCFNDVEEAIAAYVVVGQDGPVLIETGPGSTVPQMRSALNNHGISTNDIHHVFVTHIHLDHAGAAGWWAVVELVFRLFARKTLSFLYSRKGDLAPPRHFRELKLYRLSSD